MAARGLAKRLTFSLSCVPMSDESQARAKQRKGGLLYENHYNPEKGYDKGYDYEDKKRPPSRGLRWSLIHRGQPITVPLAFIITDTLLGASIN